jgi:hypothetical protein
MTPVVSCYREMSSPPRETRYQGRIILQEGYDKVSSIPTYFKICDEQADNFKEAEEILVGKAVGDLHKDVYWRRIVN